MNIHTYCNYLPTYVLCLTVWSSAVHTVGRSINDEVCQFRYVSYFLLLVEKFQASFILLRSFGSATTYLNPESTRFHGMYVMEFDALGHLLGANVKVTLSLACACVCVYVHVCVHVCLYSCMFLV